MTDNKESEDFLDYLTEARNSFCKQVAKYSVSDHLYLRTEVDSFLIAFDQAKDRLEIAAKVLGD